MYLGRRSLFVFVTVVLISCVSARRVNISNTWMLPEEDFPVFYRYFRDRISWYEADAVCQFHHANLVTADTTSQYDAIRAYLKELDINENIWIGLSRATDTPNFLWTNFQPLNGDGHWQQLIPQRKDPLCVSMDPSADFLWKPLGCGGPDVASFICELQVPSWATGARGCLLTELPSLTVLYIPEQLALELTSDCGLDGTKRIACRGKTDREELLKQLTCAISSDDFEDKSTKLPDSANVISSTAVSSSEEGSFSSKTTKPWIWTSNTIDTDYGMPTRHRRETENTLNPISTKSTSDMSTMKLHILESTEVDLDTASSRFEEIESTSISDLITTQNGITETEAQAEMSANDYTTVESKSTSIESEDVGEYPTAIGQGHLFGIIENGTLFDIIEVNETSEDSKFTQETEESTIKSSTDRAYDNLYTTVVYHKEPPSETSYVTNKSPKKYEKHIKSPMTKDSKKLTLQSSDKFISLPNSFNNLRNYNRQEKNISKEVEFNPILTDSSIKLNRTHRKELPLNEPKTSADNIVDLKVSNFNFSNVNELNAKEHQHIEIKWHQNGNKNLLPVKLVVTTKRSDSSKKLMLQKENIELLNNSDETFQKIDSKIDLLNDYYNNSKNNNSENFTTTKPEKMRSMPDESVAMKQQFLPKPLINEIRPTDDTSASALPNESLEAEPEAQPRPNRQRQLTRTQRRSFYPYFFSRVLG